MAIGERIQFTMYLDPKDRGRAYVTSAGGQSSFINHGDMYAMAAEYASYLTEGSLIFIRSDGQPAPVAKKWEPSKWLAESKSRMN